MSNTVGRNRLLFISSDQGTPLAFKNDEEGNPRALNTDMRFNIRDPITSNWDTYGGTHPHAHTRVQVALLNVVLPVSFYGVSDDRNVFIVETMASASPTEETVLATYTFTLPPKNYDGSTLAPAVEAALFTEVDNIGVVKVAWDPDTLRLNISNDSVANLRFNGKHPDCTAARVLGITNVYEYVAIDVDTDPFPYPIDVGGPRYIVFDTDLPTDASDTADATKGMLGAVPVTAEPNRLLLYAPSVPQYVETSVDQLNTIRVRLTDESHQLVDLQGVKWSAQLSFR